MEAKMVAVRTDNKTPLSREAVLRQVTRADTLPDGRPLRAVREVDETGWDWCRVEDFDLELHRAKTVEHVRDCKRSESDALDRLLAQGWASHTMCTVGSDIYIIVTLL